jgi:uncharacterized OB-fold protein
VCLAKSRSVELLQLDAFILYRRGMRGMVRPLAATTRARPVRKCRRTRLPEADLTLAKPGHRSIWLDGAGKPFIQGYRCGTCEAVTPELTMACRACGERLAPTAYRSEETGALWSWTVVHRSYPGIKVPFVSAIVDLDGGLTLKGTVIGTDEAQLRQGLPLQLVFDDAGGARDKDDAPWIGFHFVVRGDA